MGIPKDLNVNSLVENLNFAYREKPSLHFRKGIGSDTIIGVHRGLKFHLMWDSGDRTWLCTTSVLGSSFGQHAHTPMLAFQQCVRRVQEHLNFVADHELSKLTLP